MTIDNLITNVHSIGDINDTQGFKEQVSLSYSWLKDNFDKMHVDELVVARAQFTDALLCHAWKLLDLHSHKHLSLCAVGGYGRGQLQPHSDIDLLILSKSKLKKEVQDDIGRFITFLWDVSLEVGQSVRTIKETVSLAKSDVTIATNLVEARILIGCNITFNTLWDKISSQSVWSSKSFFLAKIKEQTDRHKKFNDTSYNLEPNVKENPGCLRDIQNIGWVAKKHFREYDGMTLIGHGFFTELEHAELIECRSNLWKIRFALHLVANRSENRLLFDYQPDVAALLGYGSDKAAVEKMMKHLFRIVSRITELNSMLLQRFNLEILGASRSKPVILNDYYYVHDGMIGPRHEHCFSSPLDILAFLSLIKETPDIKGIDADCIRQIRNARREFESSYYCEIEECRQALIDLFSDPNFFDLGWNILYQGGIFQSYLPEWDKIVGMMQFDLFHAYTVDEHTHRLVKHVRRYYTEPKEFPRCSRIVKNLDEPRVLFIAAIFHDIAKGRNGDHSVLGAEDVKQFCTSHDIPDKQSNMIAWLVKNHLLMSVVAQRRDIYDPEVIKEFASEVKSHTHLDLLYVLTLADIRATNDSLWNDWKASLLKELYLMTQQALDNGLECQRTFQERVDEHIVLAQKELASMGTDADRNNPFWIQMRDDYFARFKPKQIAWHTSTILKAGVLPEDEIVVATSNDTTPAGTELLIYCKDKPALFAQIASVLDSRNCSIHDAQIVITNTDYVFDNMIILDHNGDKIASQEAIKNLATAVHSQLTKPGRSHQNKRRMSRQMKQLDVTTKVRFYSSQEDTTLIELEALDAPGLLARVGHLFVDLNITLKMAKIATIGERAEDVFIVSNADGKALTQEQQVLLKKQLIMKLDQPEVNTAI